MTTYRALVTHVVPQDIARGAQRYADLIAAGLEGRDHHELITIFSAESRDLDEDRALDVPTGTMRRLGFDVRALIRLRKALHEAKPDVLVAHGGEALKYCAFIRPSGTRLVYLRIGVSSRKGANPVRRVGYSALLRVPHSVVAVSDAVRQELVNRYGFEEGAVTVIWNARDEEVFRPRSPEHRSSSSTLCFVGRLTPTKRPGLFVDVVRELCNRDLSPRALLVGDGPLLASMRAATSDSRIEVLGKRTDIPRLLSESDIFLFTSVSEGEGMPGVLIEAALTGLPVVTTDVPGARDVVEDGVTGFVVPEDDKEQLVDRAHQLILDLPLQIRMGRYARDRAVQRFSKMRTLESWQTLIDGLVDEQP